MGTLRLKRQNSSCWRVCSGFLPGALFISLLAMGACNESVRESRVHYVQANAVPDGDGSSWEAAFDHPQDALDEAVSGDMVWVAEGVYGPLSPAGKEVVGLVGGVEMLGGFNGTESDSSQRDPSRYPTVLDGQGVTYHVVTGADEAVLDGFTVTGGNANGDVIQSVYGGTFKGGGMFNAGVSPVVRNCVFTGNAAITGGGAIYNEFNQIRIENCTFENNIADFGGALENRVSEPQIINVFLRGNVSLISGGAVANFGGAPRFINSVFSGNASTYIGGGVLSNGSDAVFINCSFTGNSANMNGSGIGIYEGRSQVTNSILWDNRSSDALQLTAASGEIFVNYSIVQGGYPGTGNLDEHPLFKRNGQWDSNGFWIDGDYELADLSPAIDRGTAVGAPTFDVLNNLRPYALAHDLGAYEKTD